MELGRGPVSCKKVTRDEVTVKLIIVQEELLEVDPLLHALREFT